MNHGNDNHDALDAMRYMLHTFSMLPSDVLIDGYDGIGELIKNVEKIEDEPSVLEIYLDFHLGQLHIAMEDGNEDNIKAQKEQLTRIHNRLQQLGWTPSKTI